MEQGHNRLTTQSAFVICFPYLQLHLRVSMFSHLIIRSGGIPNSIEEKYNHNESVRTR